MPYGDDGTYYPEEGSEGAPSYQGPSDFYTWLQDWMTNTLGTNENIMGLLDEVRGTTAPNFLEMLPFGMDQAGDWITRKLGGGDAAERAGEFSTRSKDTANRAYREAYNKFRSGTARTGGRGSSTAAKTVAEGTRHYADTMSNIDAETLRYEDELRSTYTNQGLGGMNVLQSIVQGDWQNVLQNMQLLLSSTGPEMQMEQMDLNSVFQLMGMDQGVTGEENDFAMQLWQTIMGQGGGGGSEFNPWMLLPLIMGL